MATEHALPTRHDFAGFHRMAGVVLAFCAAGGVAQAVADRNLSRRKRFAAVALGSAATTASVWAARRPEKFEQLLRSYQPEAVAVGSAPLALAPFLGGGRTPLHMLSAAGVAFSSSVYDRRKGALYAAGASAFWIAQGLVTWDPLIKKQDKTAWFFVVFPATLGAGAAIAPAARQMAGVIDNLGRALDRSEGEVSQLDEYGAELYAALEEVGNAIEAARDGAEAGSDADQFEDVRRRAGGRLLERLAVLGVWDGAPPVLEDLIRGVVASMPTYFEGQELPDIDVRGVDVADRRALALVGAVTVSAVNNAARHGDGQSLSRIRAEASTDAGGLVLIFQTGCAEVGQSALVGGEQLALGAGLAHEREQAERLGGRLELVRTEDGTALFLALPLNPDPLRRSERTSEKLLDVIDEVFGASVWLCAAMIVALAFGSKQLAEGGRFTSRRGSQALSVGTISAYGALDVLGLIGRRRPPRTLGAATAVDWADWVQRAAIAAAFFIPHHEHSMFAGWSSNALARHRLVGSGANVHRLALGHTLAIALSYRGDVRGFLQMASHELVITVAGPLVSALLGGPRLDELVSREEAVRANQSRVEALHRLADDFHRSHPCTTQLERLVPMIKDDHPARPALEKGESRLNRVDGLLPKAPDGDTLAEELVDVVGRRIWPIPLDTEVDHRTLRRLPRNAVAGMALRQRANHLADEAADVLLDQHPPRWNGRPSIQRVTLHLDGRRADGSIRCRLLPHPRSAQDERLAVATARLGGSVVKTGREGEIHFRLYPGEFLGTGSSEEDGPPARDS